MSRCFPFPPPGYEIKARPVDAELVKKKNRERRLKKEKKDKEKREGKEKRERDRSDGKHTEKDRKEKRRDKKKDREKDKGKDKDSTLVENRVAGQFEGYKGENQNQKGSSDKHKGSIFEERNSAGNGYNGETRGLTKRPDEVAKGSRRIQDDNGRTGNHLVKKLSALADRRKETIGMVAIDTDTQPEFKGKGKKTRAGSIRSDEKGFVSEATYCQNEVQNFPRPIQNRIKRKEKIKEKAGDLGDEHKEKNGEKWSQEKDGDRDKEKKKVEKLKQKAEQMTSEKDKFKASNENNLTGIQSIYPLNYPKDGDSRASGQGKLRKLEEVETNGLLHDNVRPSKLPKTASLHSLMANAAKSEHFVKSISLTSDSLGLCNSIKLDEGQGRNGIINSRPASTCSTKHSLTSMQVTDNIAAIPSVKPPHPDSEYLSQVFSVPRAEEWYASDDQEWLLGSHCSESKKPGMETSAVDNKIQWVWSEALQIDSSDVCALPYVIPY